jgi:hypothetical protein
MKNLFRMNPIIRTVPVATVILLVACLIIGVFIMSSCALAQETCGFFKKYRNNPSSAELKKLNAEHMLGELCSPKYPRLCKPEDITLARLQEMGFSEDDEVFKEILNSKWVVRISEVDIDNDGINEIRFFFTGGTAYCTPSYFFKRDTAGKFHYMSEEYQVLSQEGNFCGGGYPSFIRYKGKVYVLEFEGQEYAGGERIILYTVWLGSDNHFSALCTYDIPKKR